MERCAACLVVMLCCVVLLCCGVVVVVVVVEQCRPLPGLIWIDVHSLTRQGSYDETVLCLGGGTMRRGWLLADCADWGISSNKGRNADGVEQTSDRGMYLIYSCNIRRLVSVSLCPCVSGLQLYILSNALLPIRPDPF